jgi:hypothetical protein
MKPIRILFCLLFMAVAAHAERAALVIGNADYADTGQFPDLATTTKDAREMGRLMKESGTFGKVVILEDVTRLEMEEALSTFAATLSPGDEAVFYFAGHGIEYERKVYLMGTNAEFRFKAKLPEEAVSEETISQTLAATGAKISVLLLDCCRQKPGNDWLATETKSRGTSGGYAAPAPPPNVIVGYATSAGRLANDNLTSADQNGPLVQAIRKHWSAGLEFDQLWKAVSREVFESSQKALSNGATGIDLQMPSKYGQTIHDFFFTPPTPGANPGKPSPAQAQSPAPMTPAQPMKNDAPAKPTGEEELLNGKWVKGWGEMGYVQSPYSEWSRMVDVSKLPVGSKVRCEQTGKYFLVPPRETQKGTTAKGGLPVQPPGAGTVVQ